MFGFRFRANHEQPQSEREIRRFVAELRHTLNDEKLDIIWNPKCVMVKGGSYSPLGKLIPAEYDGRWQVIRRAEADQPGDGRDFIVICTVRTYVEYGGVLAFEDKRDSSYEPVDERLIQLLRAADARNVAAFSAVRDRIWAENDRREAQHDRINDAEAREGLDRAHFKGNYAGGVGNWQGKGVDVDPKSGLILPSTTKE